MRKLAPSRRRVSTRVTDVIFRRGRGPFMLSLRSPLLPLMLVSALATPAAAQDYARAPAVTVASVQGFDQVVYKGLVGNVLDAIPMDPSDRLGLQKTNAVVSNTLFGRSLAIVAGLSNPILLVGGFVWGIWAASNIKPAEAELKRIADSAETGIGAATQESLAALGSSASAADDAPASKAAAPVLLSSLSAADTAVVSRPHVFRVWLPQRSSAQAQ